MEKLLKLYEIENYSKTYILKILPFIIAMGYFDLRVFRYISEYAQVVALYSGILAISAYVGVFLTLKAIVLAGKNKEACDE